MSEYDEAVPAAVLNEAEATLSVIRTLRLPNAVNFRVMHEDTEYLFNAGRGDAMTTPEDRSSEIVVNGCQKRADLLTVVELASGPYTVFRVWSDSSYTA